MDLLHIRHRELFSEVAELKDKKLFFCSEGKRLKGASMVTWLETSFLSTSLRHSGLYETRLQMPLVLALGSTFECHTMSDELIIVATGHLIYTNRFLCG